MLLVHTKHGKSLGLNLLTLMPRVLAQGIGHCSGTGSTDVTKHTSLGQECDLSAWRVPNKFQYRDPFRSIAWIVNPNYS